MFNFIKDKLKALFGSSKKKEPTPNKPKAKKEPEKSKPLEKKTKKKLTKIERLEERKTTEEVLKDIKKEGLELKTPEEKFEQEQNVKKEEKEQIETPKTFSFFEKLRKVFTYQITESDFEEIFSELELLLLESNVALEVVETIKENLKKELVNKEVKKDKIHEEIRNSLKKAIMGILYEPEDLIERIQNHKKNSQDPFVILFFGVNGAGKTTSIAKLANLMQKNKLSCILAAGDTFRAASIEQLQIHADKLKVKMIKHEYNSDPSAVAFDAIKYAKTNKIDVVLIDTAGRMHTKSDLLREMEKICRVTKPHVKAFVAEAVSGNDAIEQARAFNELIKIDGSILSKVDVDEKGGTILSVGYVTKRPILYLGTGQNYEDIELFNKEKFIDRLGL